MFLFREANMVLANAFLAKKAMEEQNTFVDYFLTLEIFTAGRVF